MISYCIEHRKYLCILYVNYKSIENALSVRFLVMHYY